MASTFITTYGRSQLTVAARKLHQQVRFDVVHHVTFVKYTMPSFMALLPVPFVWGPVGGGETTPSGFWWSFSLRGKVFEIFRVLARRLGEFDPFVRLDREACGAGVWRPRRRPKPVAASRLSASCCFLGGWIASRRNCLAAGLFQRRQATTVSCTQ